MFPRRNHLKSRTGCKRCKQRKVKCDEVHPECTNCIRHGVECDYKMGPSYIMYKPNHKCVATHRKDLTTSLTNKSCSSSTRPKSLENEYYPPPERSFNERLFELKLFYQFTSHKYNRIYHMPALFQLFTKTLPTLALQHSFLMDAILATTAQHQCIVIPQDRLHYEASHRYMARSIEQFLETMATGVNPSNAEACVAVTLLIAFHSIVARKLDTSTTQSLPVQWFTLFRGINTVMIEGGSWVRDHPFKPVYPGARAMSSIAPPHEALTPLLADLDRESADPEQIHAYEYAVGYLSEILRTPDRRFFLRFLGDVPPRFVRMFTERDQRALAIGAAYFTSMRLIDRVWWMEGMAERESGLVRAALTKRWRERLLPAVEAVRRKMEEMDRTAVGRFDGDGRPMQDRMCSIPITVEAWRKHVQEEGVVRLGFP
ncbi:hypothetical protein M501DRAFT_939798 [Patellaria atrata CBS 101060]|uniref:Zn(2)-C6 fungal-type domain-containing protein n=1 Tax=Patellaria atrata CBS 101060 TaxID=1346257 RepID=A0A9P4S5D1_9PEZI|nr:hypothetical protein M501DRAFT_939798 [Patellaria atrata CBS 101060]